MEYTAKNCFRAGMVLSLLSSVLITLCFNLIIYAYPTSAKPSPLPDVDLKSCFICSYQDVPECSSPGNGATDKATCEAILSFGGKDDCEWIDNQCQNRFKVQCDNKLEEVALDYDWLDSLPFPRPDTDDYPEYCTTRDYYYAGHSGPTACPAFFNSVEACVVGMTEAFPNGTPLSLNFVNDGCSTFANASAVNALVQNIQNNLPAGVTVSVTGNQATSSIGCESHMTITFTNNTISTTYGSCHVGTAGNFCFTPNQRILCTDSNNQTRDEICCANGIPNNGGYSNSPNAWIFGTICPVLSVELSPNVPPLTTGPSTGSCNGFGQAYWCSTSTTQAQSQAQTCLDASRNICQSSGRTFIPQQCTQTQSNGFTTCTVNRSCPWICASPSLGI